MGTWYAFNFELEIILELTFAGLVNFSENGNNTEIEITGDYQNVSRHMATVSPSSINSEKYVRLEHV